MSKKTNKKGDYSFEEAIFDLLLDIEKQQVELRKRFNKLIKILGYGV